MLPTINHWYEGGYFCDKTLTASLLTLKQRKRYISICVEAKVPKLIQEHIFNTIENLLNECNDQHLKDKGTIEVRITACKKAVYIKTSFLNNDVINKVALSECQSDKLQMNYSNDELVLTMKDEVAEDSISNRKQYHFSLIKNDDLPIYIDSKLKKKSSEEFQRLLLTMAIECINNNRKYFIYHFGKPAYEMQYNYNQIYYHKESLDRLKQIKVDYRNKSIVIERDWNEIYLGTDKFYLGNYSKSQVLTQNLSIFLFPSKVLISEYYDEALISKKAEIEFAIEQMEKLSKIVKPKRRRGYVKEKTVCLTLDDL